MRKLVPILAVTIGLLLSGCSYRPLYSTGGDGKGVAVAMAGIAVDEQKSRAGQIVRNHLISALGGSGTSDFALRLMPEEKSQQISSLSTRKLERYRYNLKVKYELVNKSTSEVVLTGSSFSNVSYDTVEQPIADLKAAETARDRAGREVADDIRLRLAAHFSAAN